MAGVSWAVGWSKPDFWGKAELAAQRAAGDVRLLVKGTKCRKGEGRISWGKAGPQGAAGQNGR